MIKRMLCASLASIGLLGLALVVGAHDPPARDDFDHRGHGGPGGPGGPMHGSAGCAPNCPQYQFTYTRKTIQPVLLADGPNTVTNNTTGTIAGDVYGSTYRDVTLSAVGPWASQPGPQEFIFVRDLDPKVMMNYIENVTKGTYEQFPIQPDTPPDTGNPNPNWKGGGPNKGPASGMAGNTRTVTKLTNYIVDSTFTCPDAEKTTITHGADSTTNRVYCSTLHLVVEEESTDPRFGSSTYKLSNYTALTKFPFTPTGTLVERRKFGHGGGPGGAGQRQLPPSP